MASQLTSARYLGDFAFQATVDVKFNTVDEVGLPTVLAGSPVVQAYKNNDVAQIGTGITLTTNFDGIVGLNHVRVVTADDGTFYAPGETIHLVITTGTVDATSVVGYVVGVFSIRARNALLDVQFSEPVTPFTWANATVSTILAWLGALARNRIVQTNAETSLRNDADNSNIGVSPVASDANTFTRGEWA